MHELIKPLKSFLKISDISIDNVVFKLHYKASFILLMTFAMVISATQYFGDPISCIVDEIPVQIMNMYCWVYSTYTLPSKVGDQVGKDVAHPGVATSNNSEDEIKHHQYYQWVGFMLMFQAMFFYVPRYLWKSWEEGRVRALASDMNRPMIGEESKTAKKKVFVEYFETQLGSHDEYFWKFFLCEILNLVNVIGQIFLTDLFLDGEFLTYGPDVSEYSHAAPEERLEDPKARVFPKATKCVFHKYGPSGGVQRYDGLCILPLNILNEKIYVILWFWFVILAVVSGLTVIYRLSMILIPRLRNISLPFGYAITYKEELNTVLSRGGIGDWFILLQLKKNMDSLVFQDFVTALANGNSKKFT